MVDDILDHFLEGNLFLDFWEMIFGAIILYPACGISIGGIQGSVHGQESFSGMETYLFGASVRSGIGDGARS